MSLGEGETSSHEAQPLSVIVQGLGYGDEGKGKVVDFLVRELGSPLVVRYNGGPQAAHRVVTGDGRSHVFSQFGAGSFVEGVETRLSPEVLMDPLALVNEGLALARVGVTDGLSRLQVSAGSPLITPYQRLVNRVLEFKRGGGRHGSCGMGVAEAWRDSLLTDSPAVFVGDVGDSRVLLEKLKNLRALKTAAVRELLPASELSPELALEWKTLEDPGFVEVLGREYERIFEGLAVLEAGKGIEPLPRGCIFEGAQGTLLDREFGFWPYVTPSSPRVLGALSLLDADDSQVNPDRVHKLGLLRVYSTRHGPGPFVTEDPVLSESLLDPRNGSDPWQGNFRCGWFDMPALRYALALNGGMDSLALTNLDRLGEFDVLRVCVAYELKEGGPGNDESADLFQMASENGRTLIRDIRPPAPLAEASQGERVRLTEALLCCRPVYRDFRLRGGRPQDPERFREFIDFLESEEGAALPVSLVSVGETAAETMMLRELS